MIFFDSKIFNDFLVQAPAGSLARQIYEKRNKKDTCFIYADAQFNNFSQGETNNIFTLIPQALIGLLQLMFKGLIESDTYVETNVVVYESLRTFITKKNMEINKKKAVEKHFRIWVEQGYSQKVYRDIPNIFRLGKDGKNDFAHYNSLQEYLDKNTIVTGLAFDKLDYLFRVYFALVIAILLLNLVHYSAKKVTRRQIRIWFLRILLYLTGNINSLVQLFSIRKKSRK